MSTIRVPRTKPAETQAGESDSMPEAMYLQIHGGGSSTMRMIELPAGPVRIGRGAHCEVRLAETELAEVQCILRLRGNNWHYQPVGPAGRVWIDGRPAEDPRTVAQGVPFRVGNHWLTLRSARNAFNDWVSFDEPVPVVPNPSMSPVSEEATIPEEPPRSTATPDENEERLRRWQARLEQRERMLKDRQDERRWEARWKSAGESIRARSGSSTRPAPAPESRASAPSIPTPRPNPSAPPKPTQAARPLLTPPVSRIIEPRQAEPTRRVADLSSRIESPRPVVRPLPEPTSLRRPVESPTVRIPVTKPTIRVVPPAPLPTTSPVSRGIVTLGPATVEWPVVRINPAEVLIPEPIEAEVPPPEPDPVPVSITPVAPIVEMSAPTSFFETVEIDEILAAQPEFEATEDIESEEVDSSDLDEPPTVTDLIADTTPELEAGPEVEDSEISDQDVTEIETAEVPAIEAVLVEVADFTNVDDALIEPVDVQPLEVTSFEIALETPIPRPTAWIEPSIWVEEVPLDELQDEIAASNQPLAEVAPPVEREPVVAELAPSRWTEPPIVEPPVMPGVPRSEYPSARAIFAAQGRRPQPGPTRAAPVRQRSVEPNPTDFQAPGQWTMPLWLGWLPSVGATLFLGTIGLSLAYEWMVDAGTSNVGLKLALRPDSPTSPLIDPAMIPRGGWWFSNSTHMAAWAVALERTNDGEDHSEDIRSMIAGAREASPLASRARFNVETPDVPSASIAPDDFSEIGRTRDVVSLMRTGRRLRETGKLEASIRAYRAALEIALAADRAGLDPPLFDDSSQVRRYALPHEALVSLVVRDMTDRGEWSIEQWTSALPPSALASWVASKTLARVQKKTEADALADLAIRQADLTPPPGYDPAEHRAAVAESLAYRGRWTDAYDQYHQAIDQVDDDATRRAWWLNLSELAHRMSDADKQARAIEAAQSGEIVDEVTQRARKYQENLPPAYSTGGRR